MPPTPASIHNIDWVLWIDRLRLVIGRADQRASQDPSPAKIARARRLHQGLLRYAEAADEGGRRWALRPERLPFELSERRPDWKPPDLGYERAFAAFVTET